MQRMMLTIRLLQHKVTMNTPLTTFDGFPRDDLDIAQSELTLISSSKDSEKKARADMEFPNHSPNHQSPHHPPKK